MCRDAGIYQSMLDDLITDITSNNAAILRTLGYEQLAEEIPGIGSQDGRQRRTRASLAKPQGPALRGPCPPFRGLTAMATKAGQNANQIAD